MHNMEFTIILVGNGGVGKSTYIKKLLTNTFQQQYLTTVSPTYQSLVFNSNRGLITFNVIEIPGQEIFTDFTGYYTIADGVISMNEASTGISMQQWIEKWVNKVKQVNNSIPIVYCTNKIDCTKGKYYTPKGANGNNWFKISCKNNTNLYQPLLYLARNLSNDPSIQFI